MPLKVLVDRMPTYFNARWSPLCILGLVGLGKSGLAGLLGSAVGLGVDRRDVSGRQRAQHLVERYLSAATGWPPVWSPPSATATSGRPPPRCT